MYVILILHREKICTKFSRWKKNGKLYETIEVSALWSIINAFDISLTNGLSSFMSSNLLTAYWTNTSKELYDNLVDHNYKD